MKPIQCLLVDDEPLALNLLEKFIEQEGSLTLVGKCRSPVQAIEQLQREPIDLLFLDIQMPAISGLNLLKNISQKPVTIFTTAYSQYAVNAFDLDAVDYLLKPFSYERFVQAVDKARAALDRNPPTAEGFLSIKADRKWWRIPYSDILYIEGWKEYVKIFTVDQKIIALASLAALEDELPSPDFLRVHKSYIVGRQHVRNYNGESLQIDEQRIPVARARRKGVQEVLFKE